MRSTAGVFMGVLALVSLTWRADALPRAAAQAEQQPPASQQQSEESQRPSEAPSQFAAPSSALAGVLLSTEVLIGSDVRDPQGEEVGTIEQLMINPHTGLVTYAILSVGGFLGMGKKNLYVPWRALDVMRHDNALVLRLSRQVLQQAPPYEKGQEKTEEEIAAYYAPYERGQGASEGSSAAYERLYDPAQEQTVSGQVVGVENSTSGQDTASTIQFQLRTAEGQNLLVHVGPEWYLERQEVQLNKGDNVQVTGAQVRLDGQPVLLARQVDLGGRTLTLRDAQGTPRWASTQDSR